MPPPQKLFEAAEQFILCRTVTLGDVSPGALLELEAILAQAQMSGISEYYRGWSNAAAFAVACGMEIDRKNPSQLCILLAYTNKKALLEMLGLSTRVRHNPQAETPVRPFPLEPLGGFT